MGIETDEWGDTLTKCFGENLGMKGSVGKSSYRSG